MPLSPTFTFIVSFLLGNVLGSFYNVCIYRIPRGESIVFPSSHCTSCGHKLQSGDMVPVLSWLLLRGKCRYCSEKISVKYPIVELLTGVLFGITGVASGISLQGLSRMIFISLLIIISFIDLEHRIIPDRFIVIGFILGIADFFLIHDFSTKGILNPLIGAAVGGGSMLLVDLAGKVFYKKAGMGFGDVKLMVFVGLYLGYKNTILTLFLAILLGGIIGVVLIMRRKRRTDEEDEDLYMPFGPFLALGALISLFLGERIINRYLSMF